MVELGKLRSCFGIALSSCADFGLTIRVELPDILKCSFVLYVHVLVDVEGYKYPALEPSESKQIPKSQRKFLTYVLPLLSPCLVCVQKLVVVPV